MNKILFLLISLLVVSCSADIANEEELYPEYTQEEYNVMYEFMQTLYESELFGVAKPINPSYDEMMLTAAPVIMSDTFADTLGEGDCEKIYFLMYNYFKTAYPQSSIVSYLKDIIDRELY